MEKYYGRYLYHGKDSRRGVDVSSLRDENLARPYPYFVATNLTEGALCSFNPFGLIVHHKKGRPGLIRAGLTPLAKAVAASSAFPAMFPPVTITPSLIGANQGEFHDYQITDGGVFDNLALRQFQELRDHKLGNSFLLDEDVTDLTALARRITAQAKRGDPSPGRKLWSLFTREFKDYLEKLTPEMLKDHGERRRVLLDLNRTLRNRDLYDEQSWQETPLAQNPEAQALIARLDLLDHLQVIRLNRLLIEEAYPDLTKAFDGGFEYVLVSDAERAMRRGETRLFTGLLGSALRATDVLFRRVGDLERERVEGDPSYVFATIDTVVEPAEDTTADQPWVQRRLPHVRTDFDSFSAHEISALVRHGYCVARKSLKAKNLLGPHLESRPWDPSGLREDRRNQARLARRLQKSQHRALRLLSWRDWATYVSLALVLLPAVAAVGFGIRVRSDIEQEKSVVAQAKSDLDERVESKRQRLRTRSELSERRVVEVDRLGPPTYKGLDVLSDDRVVDLHMWRPVPVDQRDNLLSPAVWTRTVRVIRLAGEKPRRTITFEYSTSGPRIDLDCKSSICVVREAREPRFVGEHITTVRQIDVDISRQPPGEPFDIIMEAVYWNGFQGEETEWAATRVDTRVSNWSLWIQLPFEKSYTRFERRKYPSGARRDLQTSDGEMTTDSSRRSLFWKIANPDPRYTYELRWWWELNASTVEGR